MVVETRGVGWKNRGGRDNRFKQQDKKLINKRRHRHMEDNLEKGGVKQEGVGWGLDDKIRGGG